MSDFMGDFGKDVKSFRKALSDDDDTARAEAVPVAEPQPSDATGK
jgi:Sec-independent protein translocase protein TatA